MAAAQGEVVHTIEVGTVKRQLPVREVKPGVFVALFNPLGGAPSLPPRTPAVGCRNSQKLCSFRCAMRVCVCEVAVGARPACAS